MNCQARYSFAILALLCLTSPSGAQPPLVVVKDIGGAPAAPYYRSIVREEGTSTDPGTSGVKPRRGPYQEADLLPVRSPLLSPGEVAQRRISAPNLPPIFLIGDDPKSRRWLAASVPRLMSLHATGLVVNVESPQALQTLRQIARGLTLIPAQGDDIAKRLQLSHYPALLTPTSIEQ